MPPRLSEHFRTALITGASTGLGRAFSEMLLSEGLNVWGSSRDPARLSDLALAHPGAFNAVVLDLRYGAASEAALLSADDAAGGLDIVVNNAGYGVFGEFADTGFDVWREQMEVMLLNTSRLAHAAVRRMRPRATGSHRCALVNISSLAADFPLPYQSAYNVCKAGLTALSESLMVECAGTTLMVLDVRPGDYRTDFEGSVRRTTAGSAGARETRAWAAFGRMMRSGPLPAHAAGSLRRALLRGRSGTVRTGRVFQAVVGPFISRFGSLGLKRRIQAYYFDA